MRTRMMSYPARSLLLGVVLLGMVSGAQAAGARLYGTLVTEPCTVTSTEIEVNFGTIVDKFLYQNTRTAGQQFAIELADCDLTLGNRVTVTFTGAESTALPGLLAIPERGIAIGIETLSAQPVKFNVVTDAQALQSPASQLAFRAFVQGEPGALAGQTIARGAFSATSTFTLAYP